MDAQFCPFTIAWNTATNRQWDTALNACWRATLPHCRAYALANAATYGERADFGVISFNDRPVGIVQARIRRVLGVFAAAAVHRGPLWRHAEIPPHMLSLALAELRRRYRLRSGRSLLLHPELEDTEPNRNTLKRAGYRRIAPGYQTIWLDLSPEEAHLRAQLRGNWRNQLVKAERANLTIKPSSETDLEWLLDNHDRDRLERGYQAPSGHWLRHFKTHAPDGDFYASVAAQGVDPVAGIVCVRHGNAATYLVGWSGDTGRRVNAHNLLLWRAVCDLRQAGAHWLDLGGVNPETAGIERFKTGLGGTSITLAGGFR